MGKEKNKKSRILLVNAETRVNVESDIQKIISHMSYSQMAALDLFLNAVFHPLANDEGGGTKW